MSTRLSFTEFCPVLLSQKPSSSLWLSCRRSLDSIRHLDGPPPFSIDAQVAFQEGLGLTSTRRSAHPLSLFPAFSTNPKNMSHYQALGEFHVPESVSTGCIDRLRPCGSDEFHTHNWLDESRPRWFRLSPSGIVILEMCFPRLTMSYHGFREQHCRD
jgi:hypothetical protein